MSNQTIYVLCVAQKATGGTELLHQLVYEINQLGLKSQIVYVDKRKKEGNKTPKTFLKYLRDSDIANEVDDTENNILIIPEILLSEYNKYNKIKKYVWWLSVDNYYFVNGFMSHAKHKGMLRALKHVIIDGKRYPKIEVSSLNCMHLYQSQYAHDFLVKNGISEDRILYLSDYINDEFLDCGLGHSTARNNTVLYNPAKGKAFTEKLIKACPEFEWIPLCNMTPQEVHNTLLNSKVYIDFGNHPGKDRFPREAAISGCCVITGRRGAANNDVDICIPSKYKFDELTSKIEVIKSMIAYCLADYEECTLEFSNYRKRILSEKNEFKRCVKEIFE